MKLHLRARAGYAAIRLARWILGVDEAEAVGDFDTCVFCGATGCEDGTAEHAFDCPLETGLHTVSLRDMWPAGPPCCAHCDGALWPGDTEAHIELEDNMLLVVCLGCAAHAAIEGGV